MNTVSIDGSSAFPERFRDKTYSFIAQQYRGILLCLAITGCSIILARHPALASLGLNPIVLSMVGGIIIGNLQKPEFFSTYEKGIAFSKQRLLRLGIILFGFRLTFSDLALIGLTGVLIDACVLVSTLALSYFCGRYLFGLERNASLIIGAGSAICGAAAILATEPLIKAKPEQVSVAVASVVLFGTCATLLYPFLYHMNLSWQILPTTHHAFGLYIGSTIHEVAQVAASARLIDVNVADTAVMEKMVRVMMLPIFLIALSIFCIASNQAEELSAKPGRHGLFRLVSSAGKAMPWFAIWFCAAIAFNSFSHLPLVVKEWLMDLSTLLLTMAMAALGIGTRLASFSRNSLKLVTLSAILFAWLVLGGAAINFFILRMF